MTIVNDKKKHLPKVEYSDTTLKKLKVGITKKNATMKILNEFMYPIKKFSKGIFAILILNIVVVFCMIIFDACNKDTIELDRG